MSKRGIWTVVLAAILLGPWSRVRAEKMHLPPQQVRLEFDLTDGSHVVGMPRVEGF